MSILLWLYPRSWRRQYGAEMEALLEQLRGRRRLDLRSTWCAARPTPT
jgi:hypothetical protein